MLCFALNILQIPNF